MVSGSPEFAEFIEQFRARAARRLMEFEAEMEKTRATTTRAMQPPRQEPVAQGAPLRTGPVQSVLRRRRL
ncbi:hypothetical protein CCANI_02140 [Corynebacterium canis]|uniref:hypothetical protein n=1 Tax=Corynebacterium canis TaxID=679663 RepID=UPI001647ECB8|nr:hypothetical protein [Corynebacterium canis]WJY74286.1 hypothetical protein CCANI_02140 [Corynebacterium canis]